MLRVILVLSLAIAVFVPLNAYAQDAQDGAVSLTEKDASSTVELYPGQVLNVMLWGNLTTGYTWETASVKSKILKPIKELEFKADSKACGAGGMLTLRFVGMHPGKTPLKLVYHRPWEKNTKPLSAFEISVVVKKINK